MIVSRTDKLQRMSVKYLNVPEAELFEQLQYAYTYVGWRINKNSMIT